MREEVNMKKKIMENFTFKPQLISKIYKNNDIKEVYPKSYEENNSVNKPKRINEDICEVLYSEDKENNWQKPKQNMRVGIPLGQKPISESKDVITNAAYNNEEVEDDIEMKSAKNELHTMLMSIN